MNIVEIAHDFRPLRDIFDSVLVLGTSDDPLFKLADVAKYIGDEKHGRKTSNFGPTLKVCMPYQDTQTRYADFLTEQGLYEYMMMTKTQAAKKFKSMIVDILKQIRKQVVGKLNNRISRMSQEVLNFPYPDDVHDQARYHITTWMIRHQSHLHPNEITYPAHIIPCIKSHISSSDVHLIHPTMEAEFQCVSAPQLIDNFTK